MTDQEFDDIRPYRDSEIPAAMKRIAASNSFPLLASYVYPQEPLDDVRRRIASFSTIRDFQKETMRLVNKRIVERSIKDFSCSGLDNLSRDRSHLFVSNHRDIMLDASLLQYALDAHGLDTSEITFGANLMTSPLVVDIGKSNKMFKVERAGGNMKEFYLQSAHLSRYIRLTLTEHGQSVWIAQRNGRTKDGMDRTDQGIIKMFCMSEPTDKIKALSELHIVPVAVSYEWEPCDVLKTLELYESQFTKYTKKPGEDLNSILTGILQQKGRVHFDVCRPVTEVELRAFDSLTNNEYHKAVARLIDRRIVTAYRLYPNNYVAYDLRYGCNKFSDMYTDADRTAFCQRLDRLDRYDTCDIDQLKDIFMGIYANPIVNKASIND